MTAAEPSISEQRFAMKTELTIEQVQALLIYDPLTGEVKWRQGLHHKRRGIAGFDESGYRRVTIDGSGYRVHRLAFVLMLGRWPEGEVDHRNGNGMDNRWENLREATHLQNMQNQLRVRRNSSHGVMGVHYKHKNKKWQARIQVGPKRHSLGLFKTKEEAAQAYIDGKRRLHPFSTL